MDISMHNFTVPIICQVQNSSRSRGIFYGGNPFHHPGSVLFVQISLSALLTALLQYFLTPFGQTVFVSQMLAGMAVGPEFLGRIRFFRETLFPLSSFYMSETFGSFGLMLFMFLIGVKMDLSVFWKSGKRAMVIGICNFFIPLALNQAMAFLLLQLAPVDPNHLSLHWIASFQCLSSFYVISCFLADLKLLNSELGRLAMSASMVSGSCSLAWSLILFMFRQNSMGRTKNHHTLISMVVLVVLMIAFIGYILRPLMFWMIRRTGEDKTIKEGYIFGIFVMVLGCSMFSELIGQHFLLGPMLLGLAVPEGPPLGSALVAKLDSIVSYVFVPLYFVFTNANIDFSTIHIKTFGIVEVLGISGFMWKVMGTMLPSIYCQVPVKEAVSLALIMSVQGITEVLAITKSQRLEAMDTEVYSIMLISIVVLAAAVGPIVKILYKPAKKYIAHKRRTIQHSKPGSELRILGCIVHEDHTPSIINLLAASNPTPQNPIFFYPVHLIELSGRTAPILVAHQIGKRTEFATQCSDHIINAFRLYEAQHQGTVMVNPFTAIFPYATMHDEVCALSLDKKVSMVILPFHKCRTADGTEEESANAFRAVNRSILRMAPCSVAIFVDRGTMGKIGSDHKNSTNSYSIGVIFLGGKDDREALAYANRMANCPNFSLTVVRLIEYSPKKYKITSDMERDFELMNELRFNNAKNERFVYKEEVVNDSVGVISVIRTVENSFDLILVGRWQNSYSELLRGMTEWNEFPELGFIGDMLSSTDSTCGVSVLVVQQQQAFQGGDLMESPKYTILDMHSLHWDTAKTFPEPH